MSIASDVDEAMHQQGITAEKLSEISGIPVQTINRIRQGSTQNPQYQTVTAIYAALGIDQHEPPNNYRDILIDTLKEELIYQKRWIRLMAGILIAMLIYLIVITTLDLTHPDFGYFK